MKINKLLLFVTALTLLAAGCTHHDDSTEKGSDGESTAMQKGAAEGTSGKKFAVLDDISDQCVGVLLGSVYDVFVAETYPGAKILQIDKSPDLGVALAAGQCDAGITNIVEAADLLKNPDLAIFAQDFMSLNVGMGFNKNNKKLCDQFNTFLAGIRADGSLAEITRRWIDSTEQAQMPLLDFTPLRPSPVTGRNAG